MLVLYHTFERKTALSILEYRNGLTSICNGIAHVYNNKRINTMSCKRWKIDNFRKMAYYL